MVFVVTVLPWIDTKDVAVAEYDPISSDPPSSHPHYDQRQYRALLHAPSQILIQLLISYHPQNLVCHLQKQGSPVT